MVCLAEISIINVETWDQLTRQMEELQLCTTETLICQELGVSMATSQSCLSCWAPECSALHHTERTVLGSPCHIPGLHHLSWWFSPSKQWELLKEIIIITPRPVWNLTVNLKYSSVWLHCREEADQWSPEVRWHWSIIFRLYQASYRMSLSRLQRRNDKKHDI